MSQRSLLEELLTAQISSSGSEPPDHEEVEELMDRYISMASEPIIDVEALGLDISSEKSVDFEDDDQEISLFPIVKHESLTSLRSSRSSRSSSRCVSINGDDTELDTLEREQHAEMVEAFLQQQQNADLSRDSDVFEDLGFGNPTSSGVLPSLDVPGFNATGGNPRASLLLAVSLSDDDNVMSSSQKSVTDPSQLAKYTFDKTDLLKLDFTDTDEPESCDYANFQHQEHVKDVPDTHDIPDRKNRGNTATPRDDMTAESALSAVSSIHIESQQSVDQNIVFSQHFYSQQSAGDFSKEFDSGGQNDEEVEDFVDDDVEQSCEDLVAETARSKLALR